MNRVRRKVRISIIFSAAALISVFLPGTLFAADPKVDLEIYSNGGGYKLGFLNSQCPGEPNHMGCVNVAQGSKNWIQWELNAEGWDLTALQIIWDDDSLTDCVVRDFNVDPNTGYAKDFQVRGNGKFGRNWDENDCDRPYVVSYRIYARNRITGDEANSDPRIKNGGK